MTHYPSEVATSSTYGVYASSGDTDLTNNTFTNDGTHVSIASKLYFSKAGNTGDPEGMRIIGGSMTSDHTWRSDLPNVVTSTVTVAAGTTLTLEPDTIVKFGHDQKLIIDGTLNANGAPGSKICFTSIKDDAVDGLDTGNDGASVGAAGDWDTIQFNSGASSDIDYVVARYTGAGSSSSTIFNDGGTITLSYVEVATSTAHGIYTESGTRQIELSNIHNTPGYGVSVNGGTLVLSLSTSADGQYGVYASGSSPTLSVITNTFSGFTDGAAFIDLASVVSFSHWENEYSGSGIGGIVMSGSLVASQTWEPDDIPYIIPPSGVTVPVGKKLTVGGHRNGAKCLRRNTVAIFTLAPRPSACTFPFTN